jgi:FAD/FMN-containing dehydrogenase/Fe-S oxidoreductase
MTTATRTTPLPTTTVPRSIDADALAVDLRRSIRGEVRFDAGSRALYATDGSNYRQVPIGLVVPRDADDVVAAVAACRRHGAPILPRGGGTSLAGQSCNVAVVFDMTKSFNRVLDLDPVRRLARVEPGLVLDRLQDAARRHGLRFGPDPSTHAYCTLGGMIGNNSCGVHSVSTGKTVDNVEDLDILTYDGLRLRVGRTTDEELEQLIRGGGRRGEIYARLRALRDRYADLIRERFPRMPRRVSGYNLDQLLPENGFHVARALVGTEGTCVTVLGATVRLVDDPPARALLVLGYPDVYHAGDHVAAVLEHRPLGLEGMDDRLVGYMRKKGLHPGAVKLLPEGRGWLILEFGGATRGEAVGRAEEVRTALARQPHPPTTAVFDDPDEQEQIWLVRESGLGATAFVPGEPDTWEGWEDAAVPPDRLGDYLREFRKLLNRYGYSGSLYGHFGDGCIHTRIDFDLRTREGIEQFKRFTAEAADLVLAHDGSLSGEHGDGQSRGDLLHRMFGEELIQAFREFQAAWDPDTKMNPGKVVDSYRRDENLRLGVRYRPLPVTTHFQYPDDDGDFARATLRCVGVGKCRQTEHGTMCPSYMVTREEMHTTRGRAHLLFEMLQGDPVRNGWRDEHVKEALDLCLACKGCKGECPVNVDVATYKAEFMAHYYEGRLRPRAAYAMGLIHLWARLAALAPGLANLVGRTPGLAAVARWLGGIDPRRTLPAFAPETFKTWFRRRTPRNPGMPPVVLWPDTFTNHFHPEAGKAAVEVLEAAGFRVTVPDQPLCCGRPLYDFGMLHTAKAQLREILDALRPEIRAGVPVVGLEPSCVAVFRDELGNLFPDDEDARRLGRQAFALSEFLAREAKDFRPQLRRKVLLHGHCHHKAILDFDSERAVLGWLGAKVEAPDSGCCGMAGSFGFEQGNYEVSVACGERVLLPAVRNADPDALIIADGFSCREQIAQHTGRRAVHLAEAIRLALGPPAELDAPRRTGFVSRHPLAAVGAAALLGAGVGYLLTNRSKP